VGIPLKDIAAHDASATDNVDAVVALSSIHTDIALDEHVRPQDVACGSGGGKDRHGSTVCSIIGAREAG